MLSYFLYKWGLGLGSVFCFWMSICFITHLLKRPSLPPLNLCCFSVKHHLSTFVWGCFWVPSSIPWISVTNPLSTPGIVSGALHSLLTSLRPVTGFLLQCDRWGNEALAYKCLCSSQGCSCDWKAGMLDSPVCTFFPTTMSPCLFLNHLKLVDCEHLILFIHSAFINCLSWGGDTKMRRTGHLFRMCPMKTESPKGGHCHHPSSVPSAWEWPMAAWPRVPGWTETQHSSAPRKKSDSLYENWLHETVRYKAMAHNFSGIHVSLKPTSQSQCKTLWVGRSTGTGFTLKPLNLWSIGGTKEEAELGMISGNPRI